MNDVKRYEVKQTFIQTGQIRVYKKADLVESETGDLVSITDHQALQAENERLKSISQSYEIRLDEMNNDCLTAELEVKQLSELVLINGKVEHNGE